MLVEAPSQPRSSPASAVLSLLALAALFQSTLFALADPTLLGWRPDHGHVFAGGAPHAHAHAWDAGTHRAAHEAAGGADTSHVDAAAGVVFTSGDDVATSSAAIALPLPLVAPVPAPVPAPFEAPRGAVPDDAPAAVPSPPPQG